MPYCLQPGCPQKVSSGRCAYHAKPVRQQHARFKTGNTSYASARWIRLRDKFRSEHSLCANHNALDAGGCTLTTDVVDHIEPHRGDEAMFYSAANLQPLCFHCHGVKTAKETRLGQVR